MPNETPNIPAPPEVEVRTMTGDISALEASGGMTGGSKTVTLPQGAAPNTATTRESYQEPFFKGLSPRLVIVLGVLAILGVIGFIVYRFINTASLFN